MKKRVIVFILSLTLILSACNITDIEKGKGNSEIEFWSTYATEKILQDKTDIYGAVKKDAVIKVEACRGEFESTQIIMTAKNDIDFYDVEVFSLTGPENIIFEKNNITVRHQVYIHVPEIFSNNGAPTGWYPDALVPLKNVIAKGENNIKANQNQGLYITFNVPVDQTPGEYTGSMKVTYDGNVKSLPVKLTVFDLIVSQETHTKSYFNLGFSQHIGELDSTPEMWRRYAEALAEYRLSTSMSMEVMGYGENPVRYYVDETYDLVVNHNMSTIHIRQNGNALRNYIIEFAKKSIEENENLVKRIIVKGPDEPGVSALPSVTAQTNSFNSAVASSVAQIADLKSKYPDVSDDFISELQQSAQKIPYIIALTYGRNSATNAAGIDTYCPQFDEYDTPEKRALYNDQKERWWYGCVDPRPPYPTYHMEDTLISARAVSWMMSEYDVIGNLYWAATVYARFNGSSYQYIEDYYSGSALRFTSVSGKRVNGDGYLFYPGAHYGIFGPIASMRLEAIRDGNEEYEILRDLILTYQSLGFDTENIQRNISSLIYSGTKVSSTSERFAAARKALIQLTMLAKSSAGVCITDVIDDNKGTITYEIFAKDGYTLKNNGIALTPSGSTPNGNIYTLEIKLENDRNVLSLSVEADDKEYYLDFDLGGRATYYQAERLLNSDNVFSDGTASVNAELYNGMVKLVIGEVTGRQQYIRYTSQLLNTIDTDAQRIILYVDNPSDSDMSFRILVKFENQALNIDLFNGTLKPGANEITINIGNYNLSAYGSISYADFYFSTLSGNHAAKTVYIDGLSVYKA